MAITYNFALFQAQFPAFSGAAYTTALVEAQWNIATCYISELEGCTFKSNCRALAINGVTAHLFQLGVNSAIVPIGGKSKGLVKSASIDKVSVSIVEPPSSNSDYQWWLNQTSFGQQILALLKVKSVGGLFIGGRNERGAFRKSNGGF